MKSANDRDPSAPFPIGVMSQDSDFLGFEDCRYLPIEDVYLGISLFSSVLEAQSLHQNSTIKAVTISSKIDDASTFNAPISEKDDIVFIAHSSNTISSLSTDVTLNEY